MPPKTKNNEDKKNVKKNVPVEKKAPTVGRKPKNQKSRTRSLIQLSRIQSAVQSTAEASPGSKVSAERKREREDSPAPKERISVEAKHRQNEMSVDERSGSTVCVCLLEGIPTDVLGHICCFFDSVQGYNALRQCSKHLQREIAGVAKDPTPMSDFEVPGLVRLRILTAMHFPELISDVNDTYTEDEKGRVHTLVSGLPLLPGSCKADEWRAVRKNVQRFLDDEEAQHQWTSPQGKLKCLVDMKLIDYLLDCKFLNPRSQDTFRPEWESGSAEEGKERLLSSWPYPFESPYAAVRALAAFQFIRSKQRNELPLDENLSSREVLLAFVGHPFNRVRESCTALVWGSTFSVSELCEVLDVVLDRLSHQLTQRSSALITILACVADTELFDLKFKALINTLSSKTSSFAARAKALRVLCVVQHPIVPPRDRDRLVDKLISFGTAKAIVSILRNNTLMTGKPYAQEVDLCLTALGRWSEPAELIRTVLINEGALEAVLPFLASKGKDEEDDERCLSALRAVSNLAGGDDDLVDILLEEKRITDEIPRLLQHQDKRLIKEATYMLSNIAGGTQKQCEWLLFESQLLPLVVPLLSHTSAVVRREAGFVFSKLLEVIPDDDHRWADQLYSIGFLQRYCALLLDEELDDGVRYKFNRRLCGLLPFALSERFALAMDPRNKETAGIPNVQLTLVRVMLQLEDGGPPGDFTAKPLLALCEVAVSKETSEADREAALIALEEAVALQLSDNFSQLFEEKGLLEPLREVLGHDENSKKQPLLSLRNLFLGQSIV